MPTPHPITQALLAAIMHSAKPMVLSDPRQAGHPLIAVNPAFEALSGYPAAETVGRNCRFLQGEGTDAATVRRIGASVAARQGCIEWIVNYRRDGSRFWNLLFMCPVFDREGELLHFFGNQRDITQGRPPDLPDHGFGRADLPMQGQAEFQALLLDIMDATGGEPALDDAGRGAALERIVEAARRLNEVTTHLSLAPWSPPPGPPRRG